MYTYSDPRFLLHSKTAVYMCTDRITGEKHALKEMPKKYTNNESFQREIVALLRVRESGSSHPNICELKETFDENDNYYLVLDLISGGEMFDHLAQDGPYSESDAAHLVRETASALAFIHGVGLVHGDLKPGE
jgi:serine/threonine protein kinase